MFNQLKTTLLLGLLTGVLIGAGYWLGGSSGAIIAFAISAAMNIGSYWFSHKIVLSMYNAKEIPKEENPRLHAMIENIAMSAQIPKPKLYLIDMPVPNAFATGRNPKHAVVAVTSAIINLLDESELKGVLAHEISHVKNRDILISSVAATIAGALSYIAQFAIFSGSFFGGSDEDGGNPFGAIVIMLLAPIVATLLHMAVSRSREYLADETGAHLIGDPRGLASALQKLEDFGRNAKLQGDPKHQATAHMFIINPFKASVLMSLFSTHPPTAERIKRLTGSVK
ncbi:MAG: zinc metalloprotease HtpX [Candidatus Moranbacteria bacterium]|nr:zinc metalloprotease HtpX [Candidatus Moranbacteria bacterium]